MKQVAKRLSTIVAASMLANIPCVSGLLIFTQSLFMGPLVAEFGWSQTAILMPMSLALIVAALLLPFLGLAVDRWGVRIVMLPLLVLFGVSAASLALITGNYPVYFGLTAFAGIASIAQSPLLYGRIVAGWASKKRGTALAIALLGGAIGNLIWPPLAGHLIAEFGWRWARGVLGASILLISFPMVWWFLPDPPPPQDRPAPSTQARKATLKNILLTRHFWQIGAAVFLISAGVGGSATTLAMQFKPNGISMEEAALSLSALALAQIVGRLFSGRLLDLVQTAAIASVWALVGAAGVALVHVADTVPLAVAGCALLGLALGSEIEIAGYFSARFFGMNAFGRVYGLFLMVFVGGTALGPLVMGFGQDRFGDYVIASTILCCALLVAAALIATLGSYRYSAQDESA